MLGKLAVRNTKRSIKDYLIYLITVTIAFSLIFAFNLVASSEEVIELSTGMDTFKYILAFVNVVIIFVICFLINYTTKFMFEKRSKELGTYMLLGIRKKEIARLLVIENVLLAVCALVLAIPLGFIFSQFVSLVIVNLLGIPEVIFISINFVSIGLLAIYFLAIYVLVLLNLLRRIRKMTVHDFLYFDKQNEKKMFRSNKKRNIIFIVSVILGITAILLWASRWTMENSGKQETLTYLMISMMMLIISIYGVSATCADMLLSVLLKNKKLKYQKDNLFVTRTFASKARTMSFTFGTLSMLILLSLLCLNFSSINKGVYKASIEMTAPFDVHVFEEKQPFKDFEEYVNVVDEDYTINEAIEFDVYKEPKHQMQNYFDVQFYDYDPVMKLSDYNEILKLKNMDTIELSNDEYFLVTSKDLLYKVENNKDIEKIQLTSGKELKLKGIDTKTYWYQINNTGRFAVIVPDEYVQGLEVSEQHLIIDTVEETDTKLREKIKQDLKHRLVIVNDDGETVVQYYRLSVRGSAIEEQNTMTAMIGSVNKFVFLEINGSFLVRIRIWKFLSKRSVFMPVAKEQIRQIISENNLSSVTDVYALLRDSFKDILQELMEAELDATLGYEKNRKGDLQTDNKRNGHSPKNLKSQYGEFQIDVPRDRNGEFEPKLIPKYQRDISGIEEKVMSLYARGMSTRDIHDQLNDLYGIELSAEMVSKITDKILPQVKEWQSRPLNPVYPFVFMDCIHYKVREDGRILSRAAYVVLGVTAEGYKEILSITVGANETSKFWLGMLNDLHNRGVKDVLFFCVDGLPGFKEAIQAVFPKAEIQRCVIHMLRNSFKYVSYKDLKKFASDFKAVYNAPNESAALSELENIKEMWGKKYPYAISNWENNWEDVSSFFQFPDDIRRIMYTTNIIEGLNRQYRKVTKTKSVFPSDTSLEKMLYLASQNVTKKWTQRYRNWDQVLNQLIVLYGERLTEYL